MNSDDIEYNDYSYALDINDNTAYSMYNALGYNRTINTTSFWKYGIVIFLFLLGIPIALSSLSGLGTIFLLWWAYRSVKEWNEQHS